MLEANAHRQAVVILYLLFHPFSFDDNKILCVFGGLVGQNPISAHRGNTRWVCWVLAGSLLDCTLCYPICISLFSAGWWDAQTFVLGHAQPHSTLLLLTPSFSLGYIVLLLACIPATIDRSFSGFVLRPILACSLHHFGLVFRPLVIF